MPFFVWSRAFSLGEEHLDEQHRIIFALLNRLYDYLGNGNAPQENDRLLLELRDHVNTLFNYEEDLLVSINYPELEKHKSMHRYFVSQLDEFKHCDGKGWATLNSSLLLFLRDWLLNHILQEDWKYRDYLQPAPHIGRYTPKRDML